MAPVWEFTVQEGGPLFLQVIFFPPDFDECSSNPCLFGGICFDDINDFQCICQEGITGKRCDEGKRKHSISWCGLPGF